ncbi:MAG: hypothetical protein LC737_03410, partial [Chloroflexi bacterium]|nr:hypothetical protein [Chloroflexota bacterium]
MREVSLPQALGEVHAKLLAYQPNSGERYYSLSAAQVRGGERAIEVRVFTPSGEPCTDMVVTQEWPDGHESFATDDEGKVTFHLGPGSRFVPPRGGPHRVYVGVPEALMSDVVYSLGSPNGQALCYE